MPKQKSFWNSELTDLHVWFTNDRPLLGKRPSTLLQKHLLLGHFGFRPSQIVHFWRIARYRDRLLSKTSAFGQKTVHFSLEASSSRQKTGHFGSRPYTSSRTVHFWRIVHFDVSKEFWLNIQILPCTFKTWKNQWQSVGLRDRTSLTYNNVLISNIVPNLRNSRMLTLIQPMNGLCYHVFKLMIFLFKNNLLVIFKFSRRKTLKVTSNTESDK